MSRELNIRRKRNESSSKGFLDDLEFPEENGVTNNEARNINEFRESNEANETHEPHKVNNAYEPVEQSEIKKDYKTHGFMIDLVQYEKLKSYIAKRRMQGDTNYTQRDALREALNLLFKK